MIKSLLLVACAVLAASFAFGGRAEAGESLTGARPPYSAPVGKRWVWSSEWGQWALIRVRPAVHQLPATPRQLPPPKVERLTPAPEAPMVHEVRVIPTRTVVTVVENC